MRIYVASSWRNTVQPEVVRRLRMDRHEVYDFREPAPGLNGFSWSEIDKNWKNWTTEQFIEALQAPVARKGFSLDMAALTLCDACVLVMPCGRSAHLELGYAIGQQKRTVIIQENQPSTVTSPVEPELMYAMANLVTSSIDHARIFLLGDDR